MKINHESVKWNGSYKNIGFEVVRWHMDWFDGTKKTIWNYYINVKPREKSEWSFAELGEPFIDYSRMYDDVEMHGGVTFWEAVTTNRDKTYHKIGCDYNHLWDEGKTYTLDDVLADVTNTIDKLPKDLI